MKEKRRFWMKLLIVPVPLFNNLLNVEAYFFRFQKGDELLLAGQNSAVLDGAMNSPLLDVVKKIGLEALTTGKPIFVPINDMALLVNLETQCDEDPHKVVFVLDKNTNMEKPFIEKIIFYKSLGYRFALNGTTNFAQYAPLLKYCDFVLLSQREVNAKQHRIFIKNKYPNIEIIASHIDSYDGFNRIKNDDFTMFEGSFYRIPLTKGQTKVAPLKTNYIQLLNTVRREEFDIEHVARIVQQDTAMAISLLKLVNSLGLSQQIKSINHAAAILGQSELRKWITTAVTKSLAADKPNEITKLSLIRAKFAENMAKSFELSVRAQELFLMGLFSVLDVILDMSIADALNVVQVSEDIRKALVHRKGEFYDVLEFIRDYEVADWTSISRIMILRNINATEVYDAYMDALTWYSGFITMNDIE